MRIILDIETDGLLMEAKNLWCAVTKDIDTDEIKVFKQDDTAELIEYIAKADKIIAHNGMLFDLPCLKRLLGLEYDYSKVVDTLLISRLILPDREGGHSLRAWGIKLGLHKGDYKDFSKYTDEMLEYCINDVNVTHKLYKYLINEVQEYLPKITQAIKIEHQFAYIISQQILQGFKLNVEKAKEVMAELSAEHDSLYLEIQQAMGPLKDVSFLSKVAKENLLEVTDTTFTYIQPKTRKVVKKEFKFEDPNPTSRLQIVNFLKDKYKWSPTVFTEKGSPKIDETILSGLKYPEAKKISRLFRLQKQMGMMWNDNGGGWLNYVNKDTGRVHGNVNTNATNTGRCSHTNPNMAQVDKKDHRMREVWEADEGKSLVGVDLASLELRVLAHYLSKYDGGTFAYEVVQGDVHTHNKNIIGLQKRDSAKTMIYALVYGAGTAKLGKVWAMDQDDPIDNEDVLRKYGGRVKATIEDNFTGYKKLVEDVGKAYSARGYLIGLDGRPLHPRSDYSALNLLIQSAGAVICKKALTNFWETVTIKYKHGTDFKLVGNIHDEVQMEARPEIAEEIGNMFIDAIKKTREDFELRCEMNGECKIGKNWHDTH